MKEEIQKKTIDGAWASMETMLDREMPVEAKRRRFAWWWLLLPMLPLVAIGGWYAVLDKNPENVPTELEIRATQGLPFAVESPVGSPVESRAGQMEKQEEVAEAASSGHLSTTQQSVKVAPKNLEIDQARELKANASTNQAIIATNSVSGSQDPEVREQTGATSVQEQLAGNAESSKQAQFDILPQSIPLAQSNRNVVLPMPATVGDLPPVNNIVPTGKNGAWAFGLGTSLGTEGFKAINSYGGGAVVNWEPTRRWSIRSGLSFAKYSLSANAQPTTTVNFSQYSDILNDDFEITDLAGNTVSFPTYLDQTEAVVIPVSSVTLIEMPLLVGCQLPHRVKLFAGIAGSYILDANSREEGYTANSFRLKANTDPGVQSLNDYVTTSINRWGLDVQSGISSRVGKNWEIGLFAKLPLAPLFDAKSIDPGGLGFYPSNASNMPHNRLPLTLSVQANYYLMYK